MFQGILAFPLGEFWLPQTTGRAMMGGRIDSDGHPHGGAAAAAFAAVAAVTAANATATVLPMARLPRGVSCPTPLPGSVPAAAAAAAVALLLALPLAPAAHGRGGAADSWRASSARGTTDAVQTVELSQVRIRIEIYFGWYSGAGARGRDSARLRWLTLFQYIGLLSAARECGQLLQVPCRSTRNGEEDADNERC